MTLQTTTIDGITFSFVNEKEFAEIYNEVFKVNQYRFAAKTDSPFILDCGAYIGLSTLYFKKLYPQAKIIAFEPNPDTFKLLELNIRQNNLSDIELVNAAVSDSLGETDFYISKDDSSPWKIYDTGVKNIWNGPGDWKTIKVPTVKLSSYLKRNIDLLKLDIEGLEEVVLKEIEDKLFLIREIRMEFHGSTHNPDNNFERVLSLLARNKFKFALESERKIIRIDQVNLLKRKDPYSFMIYTNRRRSSLWWHSWFIPKAIRVQSRLMRMMPSPTHSSLPSSTSHTQRANS